MLYQMSYIATYDDVLPQLLHNLLDYTIQHTKYLLPRELLSLVSRLMTCVTAHHNPLTMRHNL